MSCLPFGRHCSPCGVCVNWNKLQYLARACATASRNWGCNAATRSAVARNYICIRGDFCMGLSHESMKPSTMPYLRLQWIALLFGFLRCAFSINGKNFLRVELHGNDMARNTLVSESYIHCMHTLYAGTLRECHICS